MRRLRWPKLVALLIAILVAVLVWYESQPQRGPEEHPPTTDGASAGEYLFCFWNVENFFDDKLDDYSHTPDKEYDAWFAQDPKALRQKLDNLSKVLAGLNGGRGPDVLVVAEVESVRAADLLRDALNRRLKDPGLHYQHVLMEEVASGRHIAPAILTRLDVDADKTRQLDRRRRILEGHVKANGHDLVVMASHWTSRLTDEEGEGRSKYADEIYHRFRELYAKDPAVDFLVCGDFNDTPEDESVTESLHATGDRAAVRAGRGGPLLLDLFAGKDPQHFGTHNHRGKWYIFDQIVVSPGMLDDRGWSCDPDSVKTVNDQTADKKGRPEDFGRESDKVPLAERGYSDHFPVTVRLRVQGK
jgi:endonuclease/exonuclease/phosphatase family metal-dependent hydrolase